MKRIIGRLLVFILSLCIPLCAQQSNQPQPAMYAVLLGTGFPQPDPDRGGPSAAVVVDEKVFVVDAGRAGVKLLVLTHLIGNRPGGNREEAFREEAGDHYHQTILAGRDLMRIDLP